MSTCSYQARATSHQFQRRALLAAPALCLSFPFAKIQAAPQPIWPTRPLRMVVGYTPGSSPDTQARSIASRLSKLLNIAVPVENRPGAGGIIGARVVAHARDLSTLGIVGNGPLTTFGLLNDRLPYSVSQDLTPISLVSSAPLVWIGNAKRALRISDLAPGSVKGHQLAYGSVGIGSGGHLAMEFLNKHLRLNATHIPYNGGLEIINGILGAQIDMAILPLSTVLPWVQRGQIQAYAICSERSALLPDTPALNEFLNIKEPVDFLVWNGVVASGALPETVKDALEAAFVSLLGDTSFEEELLHSGWSLPPPGIAAFARRISEDTLLYGRLINDIGLKAGTSEAS